MHHLGYWVDGITDHLAHLESGGMTCLVDATGPGNDVSWVYLEGEPAGGAVIELIDRDPTSEQFFAQIYDAVGRR